MYPTEMDKEHGDKASAYIKLTKDVSRTQVARHVGISPYRMNRLAKLGLVENYPPVMTRSQASTHGRNMGNKWGDKFRLRGSPNFGAYSERV
jgi:hypothetical protein